jgi:transcriptional regulator with XRE-family HTH domain
VYNRGERREHDAKWEEPLLKRIRHLKKMTMRAMAARAGRRFKHAVTALSVISYEAGQKNLYRTLAAMTDVELLAALAAGSFKLSLDGSALRPATPPTAQPASTHPAALRESPPWQAASKPA